MEYKQEPESTEEKPIKKEYFLELPPLSAAELHNMFSIMGQLLLIIKEQEKIEKDI